MLKLWKCNFGDGVAYLGWQSYSSENESPKREGKRSEARPTADGEEDKFSAAS